MSSAVDTTSFPSREKAMPLSQPCTGPSLLQAVPVLVLQSRIVESSDAETTILLSGEKITSFTQLECPSKTWDRLPARHNRAVRSFDPVATIVPSGEKFTART